MQIHDDVFAAMKRHGVVGTWRWPADKNVWYADTAVCDLLGLPQELGVRGIPIKRRESLIHPDDFSRVVAAMDRAKEFGGGFLEKFKVVKGDRVREVFSYGQNLAPPNHSPEFVGVMIAADDTGPRDIHESLHSMRIHATTALSLSKSANEGFLVYLFEMVLVAIEERLSALGRRN